MMIIIGDIIVAGNLRKLINRSEGRVPEQDIDPWVRWDGGLDSARNSSAAVVAAAVVTNYPHRRQLSTPPPIYNI